MLYDNVARERLELMLRSERFGRENPWRRQRLRDPKAWWPVNSTNRAWVSLAH